MTLGIARRNAYGNPLQSTFFGPISFSDFLDFWLGGLCSTKANGQIVIRDNFPWYRCHQCIRKVDLITSSHVKIDIKMVFHPSSMHIYVKETV